MTFPRSSQRPDSGRIGAGGHGLHIDSRLIDSGAIERDASGPRQNRGLCERAAESLGVPGRAGFRPSPGLGGLILLCVKPRQPRACSPLSEAGLKPDTC